MDDFYQLSNAAAFNKCLEMTKFISHGIKLKILIRPGIKEDFLILILLNIFGLP